MANSVQYTIGFSADTSQAKKDIENLFKNLKGVQSLNLSSLGISQELREASVAAQELSTHLKTATNATTGKINLVELNNSIKASGDSMGSLMAKLADGGAAGQQAFQQLARAIANTQVPIKQTNALLSNMITTLKNTAKWELSSSVVHGLESAFSNAISYVKNLNSSLTDIRIVTGKSMDDMTQFAKQANIAAKELSTTTKAYTDASLTYFQQGDNSEQAAKKAAITIKAANASFGSTAEEMSEYLTAVWNSYQAGSEELENYVDIMASLGAKTATSLEEIATAMQKVAATANTVGVSMEQMSSIIATVSSVTREAPESIGTSFKTILARMGDLKLGKTDEDGVTLGTVSSSLKSIGVELLDTQNNLRDMGDVITDLGNKWQNMTAAEKTAIAQVVAGKRQYTQLMALFENWDMFNQNLNFAKNSDGALEKMANIYSEGIKAAQDRAKASMEALYSSLVDDKMLTNFAKATAKIAENITNVVNALGGLGGVATTVGGILLRAFSSKIGASIKAIGQSIVQVLPGNSLKDQYIKTLDETKEELGRSRSVKESSALEQMQKQIELKQKLLTIEDSLTAKQAEYAQASLSGLTESIGKLNELEQGYEQSESAVTRLIQQMQLLSNTEMQRGQGKNFETIFKSYINGDTGKLNGASGSGILNNTVFSSGSMVTSGLQTLSQLNTISALGSQVSTALDLGLNPNNEKQLQTILFYLQEIQEITKGTPFETMFSGFNAESLKTSKGLEQFKNSITQMTNSANTDFETLSQKMTDALQQIKDPSLKTQLSDLFTKFLEECGISADALQKFKLQEQQVEEQSNKLADTLDKINTKFTTIANNIGSALGMMSSLISGTKMLSSASKNLASGTSTLGDNLGSLVMGASLIISLLPKLAGGISKIAASLGAASVAAGPIGWIVAIVGTLGFAVSKIIKGVNEGREQAKKEAANKKADGSKTTSDENAETITKNQTLMQNYNSLYETYLKTGKGQDELKKSAYELAEAYGIVGANVLIADGNFEAFNDKLKQSISFSRQIAQEEINKQNQLNAFDSQTIDKVKLSSHDLTIEKQKLAQNTDGAYTDWLTGQYDEGKIASSIKDITGYDQLAEFFVKSGTAWTGIKLNDNVDLGEIETKFLEQGLTKAQINTFLTRLVRYFERGSDDFAQGHVLDLSDQLNNGWSDFIIGISSGIDNDRPNGVHGIQLTSEKMLDLYEEGIMGGSSAVNMMGLPHNYLTPLENWQQTIINDATAMINQTNNTIFNEFVNLEKELNLQKFFDDNGTLEWNNLGDIEKLSRYDELKGKGEELNSKISALQDKQQQYNKDSPEWEAYQNEIDYLQQVYDAFATITGAETDITKYYNNTRDAENKIADWRLKEAELKKFVGLNEANTTLIDFNRMMNTLSDNIDMNADAYPTLTAYLQKDKDNNIIYDDQTGKAKILEGSLSEYIAAKNQLMNSFITDWTAFDEYILVYQDVVNKFTDKNQQNMVFQSLEGLSLKSPKDLSSELLSAFEIAFQNLESAYDQATNKTTEGLSKEQLLQNNPLIQSIIKSQQADKTATQSIVTSTSLKSLAKTGTKDMSLEDTVTLFEQYKSLREDGMATWEQFVEMDYDQRTAYLDYLADKYQDTAKEDIQTARDAAQATADSWNKLLNDEAFSELTDEKAQTLTTLFAQTMAGYEYDEQKDKYYSVNDQGRKLYYETKSDIWNATSGLNDSGYSYETISRYNKLSAGAASAQSDVDAWNAKLSAMQLLDKNGETGTEKINRMTNAFNDLSQAASDFSKTGKLSATAMVALQKSGIDPKTITNAENYVDAMKTIITAQETIIDQAKQNYKTSTGEEFSSDKIWTEEEIAADTNKYNQWLAVKELLIDVSNLEIEANTTAGQFIDDNFNRVQAQIDAASKEIEKIKTAASILQNNIETGELSYTDKAQMPKDFNFTKWEQAESSAKRAAIAAKMWSEAAKQASQWGDQIVTVYKGAEEALDSVSSWSEDSEPLRNKDDYVNYIKDTSQIGEEAAGAMRKAWDNLEKDGFNFSNATNQEITKALKTELEKMGVETTDEFALTAGQCKDIISDIFINFSQDMRERAKEAAEAWIQTFQNISDAKQKLLSGGNLIEDIAGDPSKLIEYANALGVGVAEASRKILSGTVKASDLERPSFDLNAYLAQYGLDLTSYFGAGFGTFNVERDRAAVLKSSGVGFFSALFDKSQKEAATNTLRDLYKSILTDAKMTNKDKSPMSEEQIDKTITNILSGNQSAYQILIKAINKLQAAAIGSTEALIAVADTNEAQTEILQSANVEKQSKGMYGKETNYNDLQKLSSAIGRAQEAKNNNQGFDELSSEDQSLLISYGIGFTNVDSAAIDCANALTACAEAALNFALATAKDQGYYKNSNGNYQLALSEDEYVQRAKAADPNASEMALRLQWQALSVNPDVEKTQDGKVFIGGTESSEITSAIQGLEDTLSGLKSTSETKFTENLNAMAASVDMTKDEFIQYTKAMVEAGEITATNTEGQYKQAQSLARVQKGLKTVRDNSKTWSKALKDNAGDVIKCNKTLSEMRSAFEEVLDVPVGSLNTLSEEFMTSAETADLLEKAMDGDIDAYNELQAKVAEQILIGENVAVSPTLQNAINTIAAEMDNLPVNQPIEFGKLAEVSPQLHTALNDYVAAITAAGGDVEAAAAALGFDLQYEETELPAEIPGVAYTAGASVYDPGTKTTYTNITPHDNGTSVTWTGLAIKAITNKGTHGGNIGGHKSKGSGGGGGGGKAKKIDKKDPEDEKERYHHVNKVLERLSNQFDEIDKKKSRVYGKSYLDYISKEIDLTEKQCDAYQRYIDEAKEYLALDTQRVASLGATFDEFGNIENYDQVMDNIIGKYNEFVDRYNAMSASEQTAAEEEKTKWDEWYEEKKKWIENYEETVSTIYDQQNNLLEAQNKISEKTLEGIQYKVEIHVDITDAEKDFLDYLNDTYDELLEKQGDVMNNLVRETELATSNLDALGRSKEELDAAFASGKLNQADYVEGLKDVNEQILDNLGNIQDLKKEIEELYGNTLEMASDTFDAQTEKVKSVSEAMSSYISILGLIGKGSNLKDLTKFYDSQYEYNLQSLEMQKEYLDILRSEEQYYLDRMNSAEGLTETERQQYEDLEKTIADVNSNILSDTESTLNQITEAFNNEIEIIFKDLEERIAGVGNSIQDLADAYSYYQEEQSRYVTSARELYEVNKLNRQIEKTMNETSSKVNKNLLAALQDRINKQSELNELTEYDIEMNQLQYELLLKKIALEEAQNAKSTVRLTRDSGGNYVYQYTADQDDIMTKQQEYEDVLQKINDLAVNRVQDLESQLLEIYQNTLSKIKEIAQDQTLTEEEKYDKIQTIMNQFKEQTNFIQEQYQIASDNLITSNLAISQYYGQQLVEHSENAKNGLNQTIAAMIQDTERLQQALENACANQIPAAMDTMQSRINAVTAAVNLDYNSMSDSVTNYNKVTKDAQDQTSKTANSLSKDLLPAIHSATTAWDTYMGKLKNVISTYESMYQSILKTIQAQAKLSNATAPSAVKSSGTGKFSDTTTPSAGGKTDTSSSGGGSGNGDSGGRTGTGRECTTITYKILTTAGPAQGQAIGGSPSGPKKLAVGTTGTFSHNPSPGFAKGGWSISDPSKLSISGKTITALAAGSVVVTVNYWDRRDASTTGGGGGELKNQVMLKYAAGGLADFTGPAWLDGSKSKPEMVLNAKDTENILTAVQGVRTLDASTLSMLNKYITNASLAMSFGLGNISAGSVYGTADTIQQEVHITAEFPNATNSAEIQDAFDNIINRATQYITTKR